jgi:hypothetical protein
VEQKELGTTLHFCLISDEKGQLEAALNNALPFLWVHYIPLLFSRRDAENSYLKPSDTCLFFSVLAGLIARKA